MCVKIIVRFINFLPFPGFEEDECEINHFKCAKSKKCIPISWRCDSDADCNDPDDKSDEENCRECPLVLFVRFLSRILCDFHILIPGVSLRLVYENYG